MVVGDASFSVLFVAIPVLVVHHYGADPRLAGAFLAAWGVGCRRREPRGLSAASGSAVFGRRRRSCSYRRARSGRWPPRSERSGRRGPGPVRNRQRARQPHPARLPHSSPAGRRSCEGPNGALHGVVARDTGRAARVAALAFPVYGSRDVVAAAAAGQLAAMSYAAMITLRYLARERA